MKNALTIDVEDWYQTLDFNFPPETWEAYENRIENSLGIIIDLLLQYNVKATFFVLGNIAKRHPELIRKLSELGHEIGSHGSEHRLIYKQSSKEFRRDIRYSKQLLEDITGKEVTLFRASSWSISSDTLWALHLLEQEGYTCDSSIQPFKTPLSGMNDAPLTPFYPIIKKQKLSLLEFPVTVLPLGSGKVPFAGGLYLRTLPTPLINYALKKINNTREGMIYIHPWEVDEQQPRLQVAPHIRFTHYYNLKYTKSKLESLLNGFEFVPLGQVIQDKEYPFLKIG